MASFPYSDADFLPTIQECLECFLLKHSQTINMLSSHFQHWLLAQHVPFFQWLHLPQIFPWPPPWHSPGGGGGTPGPGGGGGGHWAP